jgi:hypothetical protein
MKPDWKDAPPWANWLAMDDGGTWFWYELEPAWSYSSGEWFRRESRGRFKEAGGSQADSTLEARPHDPA